MKKILILLIIPILFFGCQVQPKPNPQIPNDIDMCAEGCRYLSALKGRDGNPGCEESRPLINQITHETTTCEQFCVDVETHGRSLCPSRWHEAKSCDDIEVLRLNCNNK